MSLQDYYNRFDPAKKYTKTLFLSGRIMQSAEANEIQEYANYALKNIGDAIFKDGDVVLCEFNTYETIHLHHRLS